MNPATDPQASPTSSPMVDIKVPSPIFYELRLPKDATEWIKTTTAGAVSTDQQVQTALNHPLTQFSVSLLRDAEFRGAFQQIQANPHVSTLLAAEAAWIIFIWAIRAWRIQKLGTRAKKIVLPSMDCGAFLVWDPSSHSLHRVGGFVPHRFWAFF